MKSYFIILLFFIVLKITAQEKLYDYSTPLDCEVIKNGIIDSELYSIIDGRFFFNENYDKSNIYKVTINEKKVYYISKNLKKRIKKIIRKEKCNFIKIEKNGTERNIKIIRD
ncbi:hypothetical protein [Flavobacterium soli]|uniref:hypothetical protein n=1 Tax=Flavobacterium soli TaxID=344881 RepID=UPI00040BBCA6|nr:hypothetical protein [Flavobacterium soli]